MRRFIAYLLISFSLLFAVGISFVPVLTQMNASRAFRSSYEVAYQLSETENVKVEDVADEMGRRLKDYGVDDYEIKIAGEDTITVNFNAKNETVYGYIREYLSFSGENFSLAYKAGEDFGPSMATQEQIFVDTKAYIAYKGIAPLVIFPVSDKGEGVKKIIEAVEEASKDKDQEADKKSEADIFLLANWDNDDTYEMAFKTDTEHTGRKVICGFNHEHIWYEDSKEKETELVYVCGSADAEGNYDTKKISDANDQALRYVNLFNASEYGCEIKTLYHTDIDMTSDVANAPVPASIEELVTFGTTERLTWSLTLVSTLIGTVIIALLLILFYRLAAIGLIVNVAMTTFLTFLIGIHLGTSVNIAFLLGGLLIAIASLSLGIYHLGRFKDEIYKGRSFKKAGQEAMKKLNLPTIDVAVIVAFLGLLLFFIAGDFLKPFGVMLFFGAIIMLAMNLIVYRFMMYLLTATTSLQNKPKVFNIEPSRIPSLDDTEEKPVYQGPYQKTDFTKKRRLIGGVSGALAGVALVMMIVFGAMGKGVISAPALHDKETVVYVDLQVKADKNTLTLNNEGAFREKVLAHLAYPAEFDANGEPVKDEAGSVVYRPVAVSDLALKMNKDQEFEAEVPTFDSYFLITFAQHIDPEDGNFAYVDAILDEEGKITGYKLNEQEITGSCKDVLSGIITTIEGKEDSDDFLSIELKDVRLQSAGPEIGMIALASFLGLFGGAFYFSFRYRLSRGLGVLIIGTLASVLTVGFFVITRIAAGSIIGLSLPFAVIFVLLAASYYLRKEKEMLGEVKAAQLDLAKRQEIMVRATSGGAALLFTLIIVSAYLCINFFGFGPSAYALLMGAILIAVALSALLVPSLLGPLAIAFEKIQPKIRIKRRAPRVKKTRIKLRGRPKTTEPEETVFIGIND